MTRKSPDTISEKIGNVLHRPLASFMGVVALFASGCGLSGLDAKPAPATVTVTTTNRHPQTTETPRATQTVRVTETVTPSPSEPTSRPTETSRQQSTPKEGDIVTVGGQITCANGNEFVGAWVERANKETLESGWVKTAPTSDRSVVDIKNLPVVIGDKIKFSVGCGGTKKDWDAVGYTPNHRVANGEGLDVTCKSKDGDKNGRCEIKEK